MSFGSRPKDVATRAVGKNSQCHQIQKPKGTKMSLLRSKMNTEHISKVADSLLSEESSVSTFQPDDESPFPIDALPEQLRQMAESVSSAYDAPIDLVAPSKTLSVVSCCLSKGVCLLTNHPDPTYGLLYMFLATRPGVAKSNVSKCLIKPLKKHQMRMREAYRDSIEKRLNQENAENARVALLRRLQRRKSIMRLVNLHLL